MIQHEDQDLLMKSSWAIIYGSWLKMANIRGSEDTDRVGS
jgi:hypothetical protein